MKTSTKFPTGQDLAMNNVAKSLTLVHGWIIVDRHTSGGISERSESGLFTQPVEKIENYGVVLNISADIENISIGDNVHFTQASPIPRKIKDKNLTFVKYIDIYAYEKLNKLTNK